MTAPWMPPLPEPDIASLQKIDNMLGYAATLSYSTAHMRRAQADAARAALEQAAKVCRARAVLWRMRVVPMLGIAAELDVAADAIEQMAKEIT